ncbi:putative GPI-anchored protein pfl2 [Rhagoletis pomonella]|uniref:putative GPI-anchored protein pfl2 n=1 Tax=Rhagoletis pomonella TaxID=28610 RepID=UPI00177F6737|nr:putative GPI-anchored protein pfl2 [Rhagoletis pomonella]XP_036333106.1 putative GPI-anchored protein pfl2 [Rhagoletis pomonella]XP_036333114.1 putative GPI-anchored protein pfl2 [Rhagoletis pomonella]
MLVATPGQAATYSLLGSSAPKKTCLTSSATPKSTTNNSTATTSICNNNKSSSSTASTLMKTISVRLNRGTEFLKDTVQKALISNTSNSNNTATNSSNSNFRNTNINNINTAVVGSLKHIHVKSATATSSSNALGAKSTVLAATPSTSSGAIVRTKIAANNSKALKLHTVPPTKIHRYPQERQEVSSTDSINKEMCHFKPILSAPTMRWKCGSKSRGGATIKIPIACLATNIKNLNCDDCSLVTYSSSEDEKAVDENEVEEEDDKHPQKYHSFKPKPSSTLLTTIITSPSHQSAFVRLVAQMKNLVNINQRPSEQPQSKSSKKMGQLKKRHTATRSRPSKAAVSLKLPQLRKTPVNLPLTQVFLRSRRQSFVQVKNLDLPTELIIKKGKKVTADATSNNNTEAASKSTKDITNTTTKKAKRNVSKSKVINIVAFAQEKGSAQKQSSGTTTTSKDELTTDNNVAPDSEVKLNQRKRKRIEAPSSGDEVVGSKVNDVIVNDSSEQDVLPPLRKSARLSKDGGSTDLMKIGNLKKITVRKCKARSMSKRSTDSFSPPMTRSRLKELMQNKSRTTVGNIRRQ